MVPEDTQNSCPPLFRGSSPISGDGIGSKLGRPGVYPLVKGGRLVSAANERGDFSAAAPAVRHDCL